MGKQKNHCLLNPHIRFKTPYTRFARDFWACYKENGHDKVVRSRPRYDTAARLILFDFCDDSITRESPLSVKSEVDDGAPLVTLQSPPHGCDNKLSETQPPPPVACKTEEQLPPPGQEVSSNDTVDGIDVIPESDQEVPPYNQTVDVMTSTKTRTRQHQGYIIGFMSKVISQKWATCDNDLKQEYQRQTAEEKSHYLETMIGLHLRHGLPLPPVRVEEARSINLLFKNLYNWYKVKPGIFDLLSESKHPPDPIVSNLRTRCIKFLRKEMERFRQFATTKTLITMEGPAEDHTVDDDVIELQAGDIIHLRPNGTVSTSPQYQNPHHQQMSSSCSSSSCDPLTSPNKSPGGGVAPESQPSTPDLKSPGVVQYPRNYSFVNSCYTPPQRSIGKSPLVSSSSQHPLSPPLTPVLPTKSPGPGAVHPPLPPPPLYSLTVHPPSSGLKGTLPTGHRLIFPRFPGSDHITNSAIS